jgi:hypothetical protein
MINPNAVAKASQRWAIRRFAATTKTAHTRMINRIRHYSDK